MKIAKSDGPLELNRLAYYHYRRIEAMLLLNAEAPSDDRRVGLGLPLEAANGRLLNALALA